LVTIAKTPKNHH